MILKNKFSPTDSLDVNFSFDNNQLSQVNTTKFLSVLIDGNLSWKTHTTHACNIISKYNGIIRKVRQFLPSDSLPTLFNTLVYPYINYCAIIWADNNNSHRDSILLLQKRIMRTCTNSMWLEHTNSLSQSLNTLKIQDLHFLQVDIFMNKFHHNLFLDDLLKTNYFTMNNEVHNDNTRGATNICVGLVNTCLAYNTIRIKGALL